MINIITGPINSGKSTRLLNVYNGIKRGDGIYNRRIYINNELIGQEVIRLSTMESKIFCIKKEYIKEDWDELYTYLDYSFSKKGVHFARDIIKDTIQKEIEPVFIDEIGPLELEGKGLAMEIQDLISKTSNIYIVIRKNCIHKVLEKFNIREFNIIN